MEQQQLSKLLKSTKGRLSEGNQIPLEELLSEFHDVFSLGEDERRESDVIKFEVNTGDKLPKKQVDITIFKNQALQILYLVL